ncbi:MAG: restriction endonuclease subunit S [Syntrophomonadaceae bacterium]|jgi:type I restriction enzyme S subunit
MIISKQMEYKQTEIGLFPADWEVITLRELGSFSKGGGISREESNSGNIPAVRYGELYVNQHNYIKEFASFISPKIAQKATLLHKGDILFTASGETKEDIGKSVSYVFDGEAYAGGDLIILTPNRELNPIFMGYLTNSEYVRKQKEVRGQGDAVVHITTSSIGDIKVVLPPLDEQNRIADLLSNTEQIIDIADEVIAKKKCIREGIIHRVMDKVLSSPTNDTFLLGDLEDLGKIKLYRGKVISKNDIANCPGDNPIYSSSVIDEGLMGSYGRYMFDEELISWSVDGGGNFFYRKKHKFSVTNVCGYMRVKTDYINYRFFAYELQYLHSKLQFDYQNKAHPSVIRKLYTVAVPPMAEQVKISQILSNIDDEINRIEAMRDKYVLIKQGMMQQLLTGKTRI